MVCCLNGGERSRTVFLGAFLAATIALVMFCTKLLSVPIRATGAHTGAAGFFPMRGLYDVAFVGFADLLTTAGFFERRLLATAFTCLDEVLKDDLVNGLEERLRAAAMAVVFECLTGNLVAAVLPGAGPLRAACSDLVGAAMIAD